MQEEEKLRKRTEQNGQLWAHKVDELEKQSRADSKAWAEKLEHESAMVAARRPHTRVHALYCVVFCCIGCFAGVGVGLCCMRACMTGAHAGMHALMGTQVTKLRSENMELTNRAIFLQQDMKASAEKLEQESVKVAHLRSENTQLAERALALQQAAELAEKKLGAELQEEAALKSRAEQYGKLWSDRVEELERKHKEDVKAWAEKLEQESTKLAHLRSENTQLAAELQVKTSQTCQNEVLSK